MKTFILVSAVVVAALAVPTKDEDLSGPRREKSTSYGPPAAPSIYGSASLPASSYGPSPTHAPVSSYGPAPLPASTYGPVPTHAAAQSYGQAPASLYGLAPAYSPASYGPALLPASSYGPSSCGHASAPASPIAFYLSPAHHLPSSLHYRAENERKSHPWEPMMVSDQEDHSQARSYGTYGPSAGSIGGGTAQAATAGPTLGLFPNAKIGGCAIPLLLSCSPSITKGQLLESHRASYSAPASAPVPAYSYRHFQDSGHQLNEDGMQTQGQDQLSEMERAVQAQNHKHMLSTDPHVKPNEMMNQELDQTLHHPHHLSPEARFSRKAKHF